MFELIQVGEHSYYLQSPVKIGVYTPDHQNAYLIDSGTDRDAGRKTRQALDAVGWKVAGILNTHSNADHIGGNAYWQGLTGCKVFTSGVEAAFTQYPILEPSFLYGGFPCLDLRHKFLLAQPSAPVPLTDPDFPAEIQAIQLPGHYFGMVGYRTPDDVVYLADCLSSAATLDKYGVPFLYDVEAYLATLNAVAEMPAKCFVPSHAEATANIRPLALYNHTKTMEVATFLLECCQTPMGFEDVLQAVFRRYSLAMNFEQYALVGSTIRSYLAWHKDAGRLAARFTDGRLLWQTVTA